MRYLFFFLACFFTLMGHASSAHAGISYTVSPLVIDETVLPRDILMRDIVVTNTGDAPVTFYPTVNNISLENGGAIEKFLQPVESDRTSSLASWIEISRKGVDVRPGEQYTFKVTLRINPTPVPGVYHAFIGFPHGHNRDEAEKQVVSGEADGTIVTVTIEEKKKEILKLAKFVVSKFVTRTENEAAVFSFKNPGDEAVVPQGDIILYDNAGKEVGALKVNEEKKAINPGEEYTFSARVPTEGMFGKYKAYLSIEYGDTQRATVQDTSFYYVLPVKKLLVFAFLLALIVGLGAWYTHRKYLDDEEEDESDRLTFRIKDTVSEDKHHDINLKQQ